MVSANWSGLCSMSIHRLYAIIFVICHTCYWVTFARIWSHLHHSSSSLSHVELFIFSCFILNFQLIIKVWAIHCLSKINRRPHPPWRRLIRSPSRVGYRLVAFNKYYLVIKPFYRLPPRPQYWLVSTLSVLASEAKSLFRMELDLDHGLAPLLRLGLIDFTILRAAFTGIVFIFFFSSFRWVFYLTFVSCI